MSYQWWKTDPKILTDIRFWLVVSLALHLTAITQPPLETFSQWRQADVLMIARNFYEGSHNILYPTTDKGGIQTGIIGCEFPIFNYLIYILSIPFGFHDWFGRLINLLVSTTGIYFYYRMVRDAFGVKVAFNSSLIMLTSLWFAYSRVSIPDTFAASLCLASIFFGVRYLKEPTFLRLSLFFVLGLLGCLSRVSAAALMMVMAIPIFFGASRWLPRLTITGFSVIIFAVVWTWYFVWWPYLNDSYGLTGHFYHGSTFSEGASILVAQWRESLKRFYFTALKYSGFIVFLGGLFMVFKTRNRLLLYVFAIPFFAYAIIVVKIAVGFNMDLYYTVMFVPPMALVAGYGLSLVNIRLCSLLLFIVATEGIGNQIHEFRMRESQKPWLTLEEMMDAFTNRNDIIAITGMIAHDPVPMYMAHRRGWVLAPDQITDPSVINDLVKAGCKYFVVVNMYSNARPDLPLIHQSSDFAIYKAAWGVN